MEIVAVFTFVALVAFAVDFGRALPAWNFTPLGLAFLAAAFLLFVFIGSDKFNIDHF